MARDEPLLHASRASSEHDSERIEEEDALLTGQHKPQALKRRGWPFWRKVALFVWAVVATAIVIILAVLYQHSRTSQPSPLKDELGDTPKPSGKRNLIFMVSDGMGPTSLSLTRSFDQLSKGLPFDHELVLDSHLIGSSRTRSTSSLITDSAAGATAFACGKKSYNSAISVLPDHSPCGTVLEAAKRAGYKTGLVVTTALTDATPACFASHVNTRSDEDLIAEQELGFGHPLGPVVDLLLGGGRCHFLPNTTKGSCRHDDVDVTRKAQHNGYKYASSREEYDSLGSDLDLPLLGLFADYDIPYELDRASQTAKYPSLSEMASTALHGLSTATKDSEKGFFLMIEGSRIDHAGHANDPVAQVHEVLEYDKTFSLALDFLDKDPVEGVLISTSDHETGGLATARQLHDDYPEYAWYPAVLANATHTAAHLARQLREHKDMHPAAGRDAMDTFVRSQIVKLGLGIQDASDGEIDDIFTALDHKDNDDDGDDDDGKKTVKGRVDYVLADMISRRAQIGWATHGHSAVDVNIYASDPDTAKGLVGNHENTDIGGFMAGYLGVDLEATTEELGRLAVEGGLHDWLGTELGDATGLGLEEYHGEF